MIVMDLYFQDFINFVLNERVFLFRIYVTYVKMVYQGVSSMLSVISANSLFSAHPSNRPVRIWGSWGKSHVISDCL